MLCGTERAGAYVSEMLSSGGSSSEQPRLVVRRRGDTPSVDCDSFGLAYRDSTLQGKQMCHSQVFCILMVMDVFGF